MFHEMKSKVSFYVLLMTDFNSAFKAKSFCVTLIVMCSVAGSDVAMSWHSPCGCLPCGIPGETVCVSIYTKAFSGYVWGWGVGSTRGLSVKSSAQNFTLASSLADQHYLSDNLVLKSVSADRYCKAQKPTLGSAVTDRHCSA